MDNGWNQEYLTVIRSYSHIGLHILVPLIVANGCYREKWKSVFLIMMFTMLIDLDHLIANPIYDTDRCSIGFHPLHTLPAILIYITLLIFKQTRVVGAGLVIHILLDQTDCFLMLLH